MVKLIEFYEMVSLNNAVLRGSEKRATRNARRALLAFERAMKNFKTTSTGSRTLQKTAFAWWRKLALLSNTEAFAFSGR